MKRKGIAVLLLGCLLLCSCGGEKEETTTVAETPKFETTSNTSTDPEDNEPIEPIEDDTEDIPTEGGGMTVANEYIIGEGVDGVIDFDE
ncbi:MAG: hypothetical protein NC084_05900 [Bacteroides sp.]|nr:hypothetical protein [Eubacterium sp.]MCM1418088.1 hypothetical protein [Roseburia sp.]MCM1462232.1 hypothetical protein [Bacteroides sp.]